MKKIVLGVIGIILFMVSLVIFCSECDDIGLFVGSKILSLLTGYIGYRMVELGLGDEMSNYDDEV